MIVVLIVFLFILISILCTRISILEEAIRELRANGCLDTKDKHTPTIQERLMPKCQKDT